MSETCAPQVVPFTVAVRISRSERHSTSSGRTSSMRRAISARVALATTHRLLASERFEARYHHVAEQRRALERVAGSAELLGGDDRRARAAERLVDEVAGRGVVADRAADGLHRFHRWMNRAGAVVDLALDLPDGARVGGGPTLGAVALHPAVDEGLVVPEVVGVGEHGAALLPDQGLVGQEAGTAPGGEYALDARDREELVDGGRGGERF